MNVRIGAGVLVLAVTCLAGCSGGGGQATLDSASPATTPFGSISAARAGSTVIVEVAIGGIPDGEPVLALGLKLPDGTAIAPSAIHVLRAPSGELEGSTQVQFDLQGLAPIPAGAKASLRFQAHFDLAEAGGAADDAVFAICLGVPDSQVGGQMGVTMAIATRDGSPAMVDCGEATEPLAADDMPMPQEVRRPTPVIAFHMGAPAEAPGDRAMYALTPRLEAPAAAGASLPVATRSPLRSSK